MQLNKDQISVLLIEDDVKFVRFLHEVFSESRTSAFIITHAVRLEEGLQYISRYDFDVIFLDLSLPDAQGLEMLSQIQKVAPDKPILILTSNDDEATAVTAMQKGAQDYLVKGNVDGDLLTRAARYAIERKRTEVERQRLVEETEKQAKLVRRILDTVNEGILTLNADCEVVVANPAGRHYLDLMAGIKVGEKLTHLGNRKLNDLLYSIDEHLPHEVVMDGQVRQVFEVHVSRPPVVRQEGGWTLLIREVTEARQIQMRAQEQDRQAAVGQLASGIAHDFNNIMGSIILYSEMLLNGVELGDVDRGRLKTIMEEAQRAASLTRQILDFSSSGLIEPHRVDLVPFMEQMTRLFGRTLPENIQLYLVRGEGDFIVNADPVRLQQVLMNLAINARDAMPSGGEIKFELSEQTVDEANPPPMQNMEEGDWVCISVSDTGDGIPPDVLPHIFEPFFTTKAPGEGSGLGLAQAYGVIKQHGGHVNVISELGRGTSMMLYLPVSSGPEAIGLIDDRPEQSLTINTLLVVEDDHTARTAMSEALRTHNYQVHSAADGQEALDFINSYDGEIDLVLSDLVMPGLGGVGLYKRLAEEHPNIKMMVMTGYPIKKEIRNLLEEGGVKWFAKPIHSRTLVREIRKVLKADQLRAA
ncbi:MAG: response regulator [Anaerolineales bacterium]|nr:response regulator [Anaerolineales bacterium]